MRLACFALLLSPCAAECSLRKLRALLRKQRARAWVCEGLAEGVEALDGFSWADVVFDDADAFGSLSYKAMRPLPMPSAADALWTTQEVFKQSKAPGATGRPWIAANVGPGMALAIESLNRLPALADTRRRLMEQLGVMGGIDLYATHLSNGSGKAEEALPIGSYGWHMDSVDALIYVLAGTKRVRVAGYTPGSAVAIDRVLGPHSAVYVPGGRWHHLLAEHAEGDGAETGGWGGAWARVLSIGLPNANADLLELRMVAFSGALKDRGFAWSGGPAALDLPPELMGKPKVRFSEVDSLDDNGLAALHRRALRGEDAWLILLANMGADLELPTRAAPKRPSLTALGLALCCGPEGSWAAAEALLSLGASTAAVEFAGDRALSARQVALRRGGLPDTLLARLPASGAGGSGRGAGEL